MGPKWEVDVSWAALGVGGVVRPWGQKQVGLFEFRIATCSFGKTDALIALSVVAASSVPAGTTRSSMMAPSVKHLVTHGAPVVFLAVHHAQAAAELCDEFLGGDSEAKRFARNDLPIFLGPDLAF